MKRMKRSMNEQRKKGLWKEGIKAAPECHLIQSRHLD